MKQPIRWGILGPGAIAWKFAIALREADGAELVAVGSRDHGRAAHFAAENGARHVHGSYEALAGDRDVDAIYIGTPHAFHKDHTILCLRHGKHVLCEKPLAINAAEAMEMAQVAREEKRALMEAMWMRFLPNIVELKRRVADGAVGDVRRITADFGFRAEFNPESRLFNPNLGGGALLDVGIYPVTLAHMLMGAPARIHGLARLGATGVDEVSTVLFEYDDGRHASLAMALRLDTPGEAYILGTEGWIRILRRWWMSSHMLIQRPGQDEERIDVPYKSNGLTHQIDAFMDVIRAGGLESDVMSLETSIAVMRIMDDTRAQWGMRYPME